MPEKQFRDDQIAIALKQAEAGASFGEIYRKMGIAEAAFDRRKNGRR